MVTGAVGEGGGIPASLTVPRLPCLESLIRLQQGPGFISTDQENRYPFFEHRHPYNDYLVSVPGIVLSARKQGRTGSDLSPLHPPPPFPSMTHPRLWKSAAGCAAPCGEGSLSPSLLSPWLCSPLTTSRSLKRNTSLWCAACFCSLFTSVTSKSRLQQTRRRCGTERTWWGGTQCSTGGGGAVTP